MTSEIKVDTISEQTSANGVTIDGLTIKDGNIIGDVALAGTTPTFTIGDAGAEDAALIFDGNAQDFYIALDDSADDLLIGKGSAVGTTPAISIDENLQVKIVATTATTSTTTGSLIAAGGVGIAADLIVGDDIKLQSDAGIIHFGVDDDIFLRHEHNSGLTLGGTGNLTIAGALSASAASTITTADNTDTLSLISTDADANAGPNLRLYRNSSSPADSDLIGTIDFEGRNNNSEDVVYAKIKSEISAVADGNEYGVLSFESMRNGTLTTAMQIGSGINISVADNADNLTLISTDADDAIGPNLRLYRNSGSPADADNLGTIDFEGRNDNSQDVVYAQFLTQADDVSDGNEDGIISLKAMTNGTSRELLRLSGNGGAVFNELSQDIDFRVESNGNTHQLFVDGGNDRIYVGAGSGSSIGSNKFQVQNGGATISSFANDSGSNQLHFIKSRNTTVGSQTIVNDGDSVGGIFWKADDGNATDYNNNVAGIEGVIDGTPGTDDTPGRLVFYTTNDGERTNTERMRILNNGDICIGQTDAQGDTRLLVHQGAQSVSAGHFRCTNASYDDDVFKASTNRSANSAFHIAEFSANNEADPKCRVRGDGVLSIDGGSLTTGGADYAEYFEWKDGNSSSEDRRGYSVVLDGNQIVKATDSDDTANIIGVISSFPVVIGDAQPMVWKEKYELDVWGSRVWEDYTQTEWTIVEEGKDDVYHSYQTDKIPTGVTAPDDAVVTSKEKDGTTNLKREKLNSSYDPSLTYIPREDRKEWDTVGLMGKLRLKKGQPTGTNWIKMRDISSDVEEWLVR